MNANNPKEKVANAASVAASQTDAPVSKEFGHTAGALQKAFRVDVFTGIATVAAAITAKHQHTNLPGLWVDGKTVSITSSTQKSATADASLDTLTAAAHGYVEDQPVVVGGTTVPAGTTARTIYFVKRVDANTIQLKSSYGTGGQVVDLTSTGTSVTVTAVRAFSISYLPTVAGDQSHMPLRSSARVVCTTGAGDSVDVLSVRINQED